MAVLVTGGAGYIGSHTCVELLESGYEVVVMDNLYNPSEKALERVKQITGKPLKFYNVDMLEREAVNEIFENEKIDSVIHFAGYKAVGESVHCGQSEGNSPAVWDPPQRVSQTFAARGIP